MNKLQSVCTLVVALALVGCDSIGNDRPDGNGLAEDLSSRQTTAAMFDAARAPMNHAEAAFPVFRQGFNQDVEPWIDQNTEGPFGWCGVIERVDRRSGAQPMPSAGRGYALVRHGACNDFWQEQGFEASAPASLDPDLLSTMWPRSGFVQQLDVYLEPAAYAAGHVFSYANSICVLSDEGTCFPSAGPPELHYFAVHATKVDEALLVAGHEVKEKGWYTFRHVFGSDDGTLTVDFEVVNHGRAIFRAPITTTLLSGRPTASFDATELGSGYIWFPGIADGLALPIDEHMLRRGK